MRQSSAEPDRKSDVNKRVLVLEAQPNSFFKVCRSSCPGTLTLAGRPCFHVSSSPSRGGQSSGSLGMLRFVRNCGKREKLKVLSSVLTPRRPINRGANPLSVGAPTSSQLREALGGACWSLWSWQLAPWAPLPTSFPSLNLEITMQAWKLDRSEDWPKRAHADDLSQAELSSLPK